MNYIILALSAIGLAGLTGCVPAYQGEDPRFGLDVSQQYFYDQGPEIFPRTSFKDDYRNS